MSESGFLFALAQRVTPGGVCTPVRAFRSVGGTPVFFARGDGARLIDVDGRSYVDFCQAFGPLILRLSCRRRTSPVPSGCRGRGRLVVRRV